MKPTINANDLRAQMARGAMGTNSPGSSPNIMPGANMQPVQTPAGGTGGGIGGTAPMGPTMGAPTLDSVRTHSLALGGMKHMVDAGHIQPVHAKAMEAKSRAHIASYSKAKGVAKPAAPRKFGALGGAAPMKPADSDGY